MRILKDFEEFIHSGIIVKRAPDLIRAKSLFEESEKRRLFFQEIITKISLSDDNANYFIEISYDLLMGLVRAQLLQQGFYASGEGAHEAEVSFMQKLGFSEPDTRFMNDLRYFRNGILYYGKKLDASYAGKVLDYLNRIYQRLT